MFKKSSITVRGTRIAKAVAEVSRKKANRVKDFQHKFPKTMVKKY